MVFFGDLNKYFMAIQYIHTYKYDDKADSTYASGFYCFTCLSIEAAVSIHLVISFLHPWNKYLYVNFIIKTKIN